MSANTTILGLSVILIALIVFCLCRKCMCRKEYYRDPIYLNRDKMVHDWYPRANGSIYGWPHTPDVHVNSRGAWHLFSGYPYYDRAY